MNNLVYQDKKEIKIVFTALIVDLEKLSSKGISISEFSHANNLTGVTNGNLYIVAEMSSPADYLNSLVEDVFEPQELEYNKDMVILEEQLVYGGGDSVSSLLGKKIPGSENLAWLGSEVRLDGSYVWKNI
jgi:hypothetical protein